MNTERNAVSINLNNLKLEVDEVAKGLGVKTTVLCRHWIFEGLKKAQKEEKVVFSIADKNSKKRG